MTQRPGQDELIYNLHRQGVYFQDIANRLGMTDTRVLHELNRILNEKAGWFGIGDLRNTFRWDQKRTE
jgi:hypothetical protein